MLPPRPCRDIEGCHWQNPFQGDPPLCLRTPHVPASCPLASADTLSILRDPETHDAQGCTHPRCHSSRQTGVSACCQEFSTPRAVPQKAQDPMALPLQQAPQGHFQELHLPPKTTICGLSAASSSLCGLTRAQYLPASPLPLAGQPVLGPGPPDPVGQDTVCKRHIHIANHIGVRLLVKGFVSDPSPRGTDRERAQSDRQAEG